MPDNLCDCSRFREPTVPKILLREARNFALEVLDETRDPSDTNTAIILAEKIEKATRFLNG